MLFCRLDGEDVLHRGDDALPLPPTQLPGPPQAWAPVGGVRHTLCQVIFLQRGLFQKDRPARFFKYYFFISKTFPRASHGMFSWKPAVKNFATLFLYAPCVSSLILLLFLVLNFDTVTSFLYISMFFFISSQLNRWQMKRFPHKLRTWANVQHGYSDYLKRKGDMSPS